MPLESVRAAQTAVAKALQEGIHVSASRTAIETNTDALVVKLRRVACSASKAQKVFAVIGIFHETHWQRIRVAQARLLRQYTCSSSDFSSERERLRCSRLLQDHKKT